MTKPKKIVIGVVSLVIFLLVGLISYREISKRIVTHQDYCSYYAPYKIENVSCYASFRKKCMNSGGSDPSLNFLPCSHSACSEDVDCIDVYVPCSGEEKKWICKCPFLKRWSNQWGCTYF